MRIIKSTSRQYSVLCLNVDTSIINTNVYTGNAFQQKIHCLFSFLNVLPDQRAI